MNKQVAAGRQQQPCLALSQRLFSKTRDDKTRDDVRVSAETKVDTSGGSAGVVIIVFRCKDNAPSSDAVAGRMQQCGTSHAAAAPPLHADYNNCKP